MSALCMVWLVSVNVTMVYTYLYLSCELTEMKGKRISIRGFSVSSHGRREGWIRKDFLIVIGNIGNSSLLTLRLDTGIYRSQTGHAVGPYILGFQYTVVFNDLVFNDKHIKCNNKNTLKVLTIQQNKRYLKENTFIRWVSNLSMILGVFFTTGELLRATSISPWQVSFGDN